jgi:ABC-type lipoprotein export system ATPase subunit
MIPILCQNITCLRPDGDGRPQVVVDNFSAGFETGTATAFRGPEDCGVGLLLNILGMIERPDSGEIGRAHV